MKLEKEEQKFATLTAYRDGGNFKVWCPYCASWHYHGEVGGWRVAHCFNKKSPFIKTGYYLKEARKKDIEALRDIVKSYEQFDKSTSTKNTSVILIKLVILLQFTTLIFQ